MKKINVTKKAVKVILNITMPLIVFLLGVLLATCLPEKQSTLVRKNQSGGENQAAITKLPPVKSFLEYLHYVENKDIEKMWDNSSYYRKRDLRSKDDLVYDYYLTSNYEVQYIIPIGEGNRLSEISPIAERTFSFYVLYRYEDDVCIAGEVDELKSFHNIGLKKLCDSTYFEPLFDPVVEEVYEYVDRRFVIDSTENVKNKLREYMLNMTMKEYVTQDWRFPVLFVKQLQLPPKQIDRIPDSPYQKLGHSMLSEVVMLEEDGVWKLSLFRTIAISRW